MAEKDQKGIIILTVMIYCLVLAVICWELLASDVMEAITLQAYKKRQQNFRWAQQDLAELENLPASNRCTTASSMPLRSMQTLVHGDIFDWQSLPNACGKYHQSATTFAVREVIRQDPCVRVLGNERPGGVFYRQSIIADSTSSARAQTKVILMSTSLKYQDLGECKGKIYSRRGGRLSWVSLL